MNAPARAITYGARLRELAVARGAQEALCFVAADGMRRSYSWAELDARVDRFAAELELRGAGPGDVVGIALGNRPEQLIMALATWRIGATTMVMQPDAKPDFLAAMHARAGLRLAVAEHGSDAAVALAEFAAAALAAPVRMVPDRVSRPGKIVLSGGSTGLPKMMADDLPFTRVPGASWGRVAPRLGFRCDQTQLVCGALAHNAPFTWAQNGLFEGNRLILMEHFDAERVLLLLGEERVGFVMVVPTMMVRMLDRLATTECDLSALHALYHTGAPCPAWLKRAWVDILGAERVTEMYGSGENTGQTTVTGAEWLTHPGTVGRGFETEIRIYREDGTLADPCEPGEIYMRPVALEARARYIGPQAPQPKRDADGFQSIGDVGHLDAEGYLYLSGRRDDVINTGGVKVYPETVEAVLLQHPRIVDAVVYGISDREWGARVACRVVTVNGELTAAEVKAWCAARLLAAEVPKEIHFPDSLPRDGFGKIRRRQLAE